MGTITFNGVSSADYGIVVEVPPDYQTPERDYNIEHVAGRNGDIVIDQGSYQNVEQTYSIAAGSKNGDFMDFAVQIAEWLHNGSGYCRLEDSYDPDHYRMAMYREELTITNVWGRAAQASITFDCKPQRYLVNGDSSAGGSDRDGVSGTIQYKITNPTLFVALPIITVTIEPGTSATLTVNTGYDDVSQIVIAAGSSTSSITIDSEIQDVYNGTSNCNSMVTFNSGRFPTFHSGENTIRYTDNISKIRVAPKWWTI